MTRFSPDGGNFNVPLIPFTLSRCESHCLILSLLILLVYMRLLLYVRLKSKGCQQRKSSALLKLSDTSFHVPFLRHNHGVLIWAKLLLLLSVRKQETRTMPSAKMVAPPLNGNYCMSRAILFQLELMTDLWWHFKVGWLSSSLPELPTPPLWGTLPASGQHRLSCLQFSLCFQLVV